METPQRQGSAELFRSIFGTLSGGLSLFANNPFRKRKPEEEDSQPPNHDTANTGTNQDPSLSKPQKGTTHGIDPLPSKARPRVSFEGVFDAVPPSKVEKKRAKQVRAFSTPNGRMEDRAPASELAETKKRARATLEQSDGKEENRDEHAEMPSRKQEGPKSKKAKVVREQKLEEQVKGPVTKKMKAMAEKQQEEHVQLSKQKMKMAAGESLGEQLNKPKSKKMKTEQESGDTPHLKAETTTLSEGAAITVKKEKQGKRIHEVLDRDAPQKRQKVSLGEGNLPITSTMGALTVAPEKKSVKHSDVDSGQLHTKKRKICDSIEERYEKKLAGSSSSTTADESKPNLLKSKGGKNTDGAKISETKKRKRGTHVDDDDDGAMKARKVDDEEKLNRTLFVGNLPLKVKKKAIMREFSCYGTLESVRLRSIPLLPTKIPKRGAIIKGQINEAVDSQHAYLVFKEKASADAALAHNMKEFKGNHLRVDVAHAPRGAAKEQSLLSYDHTRSIFVGNVPFDVKDEELYRLFNTKKPPEMGVEAVRVVRDPQTSLSIGIAYVLFKTKAGANRVFAATHNLRLRDRIIRVSRVLSTQKEQKQHRPAKRTKPTEASEASSQRKRAKLSTSYEGMRATKSSSHLEKHKSPIKKDLKSTKNSNGGHLNTFIGKKEQANKTPSKFTGEKRKRVENRQRGISRSKRIRRS